MEKMFKQILKEHKEITRTELSRLDYAKMVLEFQLEALQYNHDKNIEKIFQDAMDKVKSYL